MRSLLKGWVLVLRLVDWKRPDFSQSRNVEGLCLTLDVTSRSVLSPASVPDDLPPGSLEG